MMIVMKEGATEEQIQPVVERVESVGCSAHVSQGELLTVIGAIGDRDRVSALGLEGAPGVDHLVPILKPYKLASAQFRKGERDRDRRSTGASSAATLRPDRGPVHGRGARADARGGPGGCRRRRHDAPRRRLQAAHLARTASRASGTRG